MIGFEKNFGCLGGPDHEAAPDSLADVKNQDTSPKTTHKTLGGIATPIVVRPDELHRDMRDALKNEARWVNSRM